MNASTNQSPFCGETKSSRRILILAWAFLAISAAPPAAPDDSIHQGNQAVERGEFENALLLYQQAEERGVDPGLIAFNEATAYYHLKDFRKAENHYRMALNDAAISMERRAKSLYNLGNCLVKEAGESEIKVLRDAIRCYELCLEVGSEQGLCRDAAHNLELAKLLWNKARQKTSNPPAPNTDDPPDPKREPEKKKENEPKKKGGDTTGDSTQKNKEPKIENDPNGKKNIKEDPSKVGEVPKVGPSRAPVIRDTDELEPLAPEDARRALKEAEERLKKERQRIRMNAAIPEKPSGRDW